MYVDKAVAVAEFKIRMTTKSLALKRGSASRSSGQWRDDDYDVLQDGVVVGRIFKVRVAPPDRPWMWASGHNGSNGNELAQRFAAALACALAVLDCRGWRVRLEA